MRAFEKQLQRAIAAQESLLCVGLDPDLNRFPPHLRRLAPREAIVAFNQQIISATSGFVCAFKANLGFYVAQGTAGIEALVETRRMIPGHIPAILDCKVGDIDSTMTGYAEGFFDRWNFDAITVNGFLGKDSLDPLLAYSDRGFFILCKTSNPGSGDFQNRAVLTGDDHPVPLYELIARSVEQWSASSEATVGLVVGATFPTELANVRSICPGLPILVPGIGSQAGDLREAVRAGLDANGSGILVNASRSVLFASVNGDFAEQAGIAAERLQQQINEIRATVHGSVA